MSKRSGFTLIEVLLALGLLSIVIVSTFSYLYSVKRAEQIDRTVTDLNIIVQNQMELVMAAESVTEMYSVMTANYVYTDASAYQDWLDDKNGSTTTFRSVGTEYEYAIGAYRLEEGDNNRKVLYQIAVIAKSKDEDRKVILMTIKSVEEL
jgi:prepilin-type N-terminal cleavage/methylation domain-containing protein